MKISWKYNESAREIAEIWAIKYLLMAFAISMPISSFFCPIETSESGLVNTFYLRVRPWLDCKSSNYWWKLHYFCCGDFWAFSKISIRSCQVFITTTSIMEAPQSLFWSIPSEIIVSIFSLLPFRSIINFETADKTQSKQFNERDLYKQLTCNLFHWGPNGKDKILARLDPTKYFYCGLIIF